MNLKNLYTTKPDKSGRIVCFYSDGSGAAVFLVENGELYDKHGEHVDGFADTLIDMGYCEWEWLPDNFRLFFENINRGNFD